MNPLQVPQQGPYEERCPFTGHFAYLSKTSSFGFPSKGALSQGPLHGNPCREMPHNYSPPSFIYQSPQYMSPPPTYQVPLSWKGATISGDFLNIFSRVPSEGVPPKTPSTEPLQRETLHPQSPLHPSLKVPGR